MMTNRYQYLGRRCFTLVAWTSALFVEIVEVCVIFFFKQKTAYEMRISDWSSDVCSSDLEFRIVAVGALQMSGGEHPLANRMKKQININPHRRVQIGRASCRERVCQYV